MAAGLRGYSDFNNGGIKGIGPKKGLKLVKENNDFNKIFKDLEWSFPYSWKIVFDIIKHMPINKDYKLEWTDINEDKIYEILCDKHGFNKERVQNSLMELTKKSKNQKGLGEWF